MEATEKVVIQRINLFERGQKMRKKLRIAQQKTLQVIPFTVALCGGDWPHVSGVELV